MKRETLASNIHKAYFKGNKLTGEDSPSIREIEACFQWFPSGNGRFGCECIYVTGKRNYFGEDAKGA